ncbi:MAG TPA: hypothetical protein PKG54_04140 [Phycisphaerae bacterium]|jgi:hypothetical protein|nr:hypothetical protein [Phycisphaerae bacterium]HOJ53431.1 hypothetical protein [Phycisphaerae bacterium]HOL25445.1 hypothetical protein [Phycisphaerae bacterium]HPP19878.1 hypothetical protein [Phycisphaerae bacterium]HPU31196.1 hypothetical protein [Phycisphaerae bacterium]
MSNGTGGFWSRWRRAARWSAPWIGLGLLGVWCSGCQLIQAAAYFAQPETEKIAPEFSRLPGKQVVIYVWAEPEILWNYGKLRLDVSAHIGSYLTRHVKDVKVVDVLQVERYIEQQRIADLDPVQVGRHFKADVVIYLSVHKFSTRDPDMAHFYRGRISSSVHVYDLTAGEEPERIVLQDVSVAVPEHGPVGLENTTAAQIRQMAYDAFTVEVGRKFHEWERPIG